MASHVCAWCLRMFRKGNAYNNNQVSMEHKHSSCLCTNEKQNNDSKRNDFNVEIPLRICFFYFDFKKMTVASRCHPVRNLLSLHTLWKYVCGKSLKAKQNIYIYIYHYTEVIEVTLDDFVNNHLFFCVNK